MKKSIFYIISGVFLGAVIFFTIQFSGLKPEIRSEKHLLEQYQKETTKLIALLDRGINKFDSLSIDSARHLLQVDSLLEAIHNLKPASRQSNNKKEVKSKLENLHNALSDIDLNNSAEEDINLVKYKIKAIRDDYTHELSEVSREKNELTNEYTQAKKRIIVLLALAILSLLIGLRINLYSASPKQ